MTRRPEDDGSFLDRWSRRKREAAAETAAEEVTAAPAPGIAEITPEELAALPAPDEITAETDITPFLRRGVPQAMKNAALRRAWMMHPAIRDHKDPAVDYAWDWNSPGGVPGSSGEVAAKGVADLIERMTKAAHPDEGTSEPAAASWRQRECAAPTAPVETTEEHTVIAKDGGQDPLADDPPEPGGIAQPRRHGGARPI